MIITPISTRVFVPPKDDLFKILRFSLPKLKEQDIVVITSKVVSISEGRCIPSHLVKSKDSLIRSECDFYLPRNNTPGRWAMHTLKNNVFMVSAGIDKSNALDHYILWPKNVKRSAREIQAWLMKKYKLKEVGVIITDSHSIPLRRGSVGISLSHAGFRPINDYRKMPDLFDRKLLVTQSNIVDGLAAAAVVCMGEGSEHTPVAIIRDAKFVTFIGKKIWRSRKPFSSLEVPSKEDIYAPFLRNMPWKKRRG
jgi:dihydrofolate synthase / folylpolyglutamate synthase